MKHCVLSATRTLCLAFTLIITAALRAQFDGGTGTSTDPYRIATAAQLDAVRTNLSASYVLTADIDLTGISFTPIGASGEYFTGQFDGAGHSIANWTYGDPNQPVGLFTDTEAPARIINLTLANCHITAAGYTAGLIAAMSNGTIENCSASGTIAGLPSSATVGGLAGYSMMVLNSQAHVDITGPSSQYMSGACGGLVGLASGVVRDSFATGAITRDPTNSPPTGGLLGISAAVVERCHATGNVEGAVYVGGLVGQQYNNSVISKCYATGNVLGMGYAIGGLVGVSSGFVGDSYATGSVAAVNDGVTAGLIGQASANFPDNGTVMRCYARGPVLPLGSFNARGLIGNTWGIPTTADCFWDTETTGSSWTFLDLGASFDLNARGLTTAQMQDPATYATWDGANIWNLVPGQFPTLRGGGTLVPSVSVTPDSPQVDAGSTVEFTATATGAGPLTYQWDHDGVVLPGATTATLRLANVGDSDVGNYRITVTNSVGPAYANTYLDVNPAPMPPTIISQPQSQTVVVGDNVVLGVSASSNTGTLSYQWYKDGSAIAGATDGSYWVPDHAKLSDAGDYWVVVTNEIGSVTSDKATLTVYTAEPVIMQQPQGTVLNPGESYTLSVQATGLPPLSYQWYKNSYYITGATNSSYTISNASSDDAGYYLVYVTTAASGQSGINSDRVAVSVRVPPTLTGVSHDTITAGTYGQEVLLYGSFVPDSQILWNGVPANFPGSGYVNPVTMVMNVPDSMLVGVDFQAIQIAVQNPGGFVSQPLTVFIESGNVTAVNTQPVPGGSSTTVDATSTSSTPVSVSATLQNNSGSTETVAVATYNQLPASTPAIEVGGQYVDVVVANAQPTDAATARFYYAASLTGTAESDVTLQYYNGSVWQTVLSSGGVAPSKDTTDNLDGTSSGGRFTVVFDNTSTPKITELTGTIFTAAAAPKKNAYKQKPVIVTEPTDLVVHAGEDATFSITATSVSGIRYQWHFDGKKSGDIAGATASTLVVRNVSASDIGTYTVTATNASGSTTSKKVTLTIVPAAPTIAAQPQSQTATAGSTVAFTVGATGEGTLTYRWQLNGKALGGQNAAVLSLKNVSSKDAGTYICVVSNAGGAVTTDPATLTVLPK